MSKLTKDEEYQQQMQIKKLKQSENELMTRLKEKDYM